VLVGRDTLDDAGVYRLNSELALVQSVDFFTPVVDDPYTFGRIAAANALSDIYAMGADPITALNLVAFPVDKLPKQVLTDILRGGQDAAQEAGVAIIGGHSIDDDEPKYGLAVTGVVHPARVLRNSGARLGDSLVLTKPLGIGIISTAIKRGEASARAAETAANMMLTLNRAAAAAAREVGVNACTDVTGFGLVGHALEVAAASGVRVELSFDDVPVIEEAWEYAQRNIVPGGSRRNYAYVLPFTDFPPELEQWRRIVLTDAITSGGLLLSVSPDVASDLVDALKRHGTPEAAIVGRVVQGQAGTIGVRMGVDAKP